MATFKIIVMDADGSTLTHRDTILPDNLRDLMQARPEIKWVMATGRSLDILKPTPIFPYLSTDVPHIVDGGGRLMLVDGTPIMTHLLSPRELDIFFATLPLKAVHYLSYSSDGVRGYFYSREQATTEKIREKYGMGLEFTDQINQFQHWVCNYPPSKILVNVKENIDFKGLHWHQNGNNIDITARGIDKGSACAELCNYLGISPQEAIFIFNDKNDLPVLTHPTLTKLTTIKVGNWLPAVKASFSVASPYDLAPILQNLL